MDIGFLPNVPSPPGGAVIHGGVLGEKAAFEKEPEGAVFALATGPVDARLCFSYSDLL